MGIFESWNEWHPSEANEDDEVFFPESGDWEDLEELPQVPTIDYLPPVVDYSARGPDDFVVSGPLVGSDGPGRRFDSKREAYIWAIQKYGRARVTVIDAGEVRWACLIRST